MLTTLVLTGTEACLLLRLTLIEATPGRRKGHTSAGTGRRKGHTSAVTGRHKGHTSAGLGRNKGYASTGIGRYRAHVCYPGLTSTETYVHITGTDRRKSRTHFSGIYRATSHA